LFRRIWTVFAQLFVFAVVGYYNKIYFLQFQTRAKNRNNTQMLHINKTSATVKSIKFLGLTIDTILNWKHHSDLKPRLNKAFYAIRSMKPFMSLAVLKCIYYSYAHFIMSYGLIFCGNSTNSDDIFKIQKRIIRIITNSNKNASCRELFKKTEYPSTSVTIYILNTIIYYENKDQFPVNSHMHTINTRHNNNLHVPSANLTVYQSGVYYSGIKVFNHLSTTIKNLSDNKKKFQTALRKFLLYNLFYSLEEYYST